MGLPAARFARQADLDWCLFTATSQADDTFLRLIDEQRLVVAERQQQLTGMLQFNYLWPGYDFTLPLIEVVLVPEPHRRQGAGTAMLSFAENHLRTQGCKTLLISATVNEPEPQAWHRRMGFKECGFWSGAEFADGVGELFFAKFL